MSEHTKEPWNVRTIDESMGVIDDKYDFSIAQTHQRAGDKCNIERKANSRRIVACVNACAGVTTENLERNRIGEIIIKAERQRDELLDACVAIVAWDDAESDAEAWDKDQGAAWRKRQHLCQDAFDKARKAIDNAEKLQKGVAHNAKVV